MHYAPTTETLVGERETIWTFLGTDRLAPPILEHNPDMVLHGHAHAGTFEGRLGEVPVYNVSVPVLGEDFWVFEMAGERRGPLRDPLTPGLRDVLEVAGSASSGGFCRRRWSRRRRRRRSGRCPRSSRGSRRRSSRRSQPLPSSGILVVEMLLTQRIGDDALVRGLGPFARCLRRSSCRGHTRRQRAGHNDGRARYSLHGGLVRRAAARGDPEHARGVRRVAIAAIEGAVLGPARAAAAGDRQRPRRAHRAARGPRRGRSRPSSAAAAPGSDRQPRSPGCVGRCALDTDLRGYGRATDAGHAQASCWRGRGGARAGRVRVEEEGRPRTCRGARRVYGLDARLAGTSTRSCSPRIRSPCARRSSATGAGCDRGRGRPTCMSTSESARRCRRPTRRTMYLRVAPSATLALHGLRRTMGLGLVYCRPGRPGRRGRDHRARPLLDAGGAAAARGEGPHGPALRGPGRGERRRDDRAAQARGDARTRSSHSRGCTRARA